MSVRRRYVVELEVEHERGAMMTRHALGKCLVGVMPRRITVDDDATGLSVWSVRIKETVPVGIIEAVESVSEEYL